MDLLRWPTDPEAAAARLRALRERREDPAVVAEVRGFARDVARMKSGWMWGGPTAPDLGALEAALAAWPDRTDVPDPPGIPDAARAAWDGFCASLAEGDLGPVADALTAAGDPRGPVLAARLAGAPPPPDAAWIELRWLRPFPGGRATARVHGVVVGLQATDPEADLAAAAADPLWRALRTLNLTGGLAPPGLAARVPHLRSLAAGAVPDPAPPVLALSVATFDARDRLPRSLRALALTRPTPPSPDLLAAAAELDQLWTVGDVDWAKVAATPRRPAWVGSGHVFPSGGHRGWAVRMDRAGRAQAAFDDRATHVPLHVVLAPLLAAGIPVAASTEGAPDRLLGHLPADLPTCPRFRGFELPFYDAEGAA